MAKRTYAQTGFKAPRSTNPKRARPYSGFFQRSQPVPRLLRAPARVQVPATLRSGSGPELKCVDYPIGAAVQTNLISTTATFVGVNLVAVGGAYFNRQGRKICMKTLHLIGNIVYSGLNTAGVPEYLRVMVIYDRSPNGGGFPSISDLLENRDASGNTFGSSYSPLNMSFAERFKMIRDIRIAIADNGVGGLDDNAASVIDYTTNRTNINEYIRLGDLETVYSASTAIPVIGDISQGSLFVATVGTVAAATCGYQVNWTARLRFTDP